MEVFVQILYFYIDYYELYDSFKQQKTKKIIDKLLPNTINWYICKKHKIMARNTSILIGEYYENFIKRQIATGKYNSVSEVVRTALRHFEQEEIQTKSLIAALEIGEKSAKIRNFNRAENLKQLNENFQK
jgi:antitoxin ParD1/3/4